MKQMEYTIKILTDFPIDPDTLTQAITEGVPGSYAEVTNYRIKPTPRREKT